MEVCKNLRKSYTKNIGARTKVMGQKIPNFYCITLKIQFNSYRKLPTSLSYNILFTSSDKIIEEIYYVCKIVQYLKL